MEKADQKRSAFLKLDKDLVKLVKEQRMAARISAPDKHSKVLEKNGQC